MLKYRIILFLYDFYPTIYLRNRGASMKITRLSENIGDIIERKITGKASAYKKGVSSEGVSIEITFKAVLQ